MLSLRWSDSPRDCGGAQQPFLPPMPKGAEKKAPIQQEVIAG